MDNNYMTIKSVMIVEDSAVQRAYAADICRELGIEAVLEAGDGVQALNLLARAETLPSIAIVDMEMPRMDGFEFVEELQARDYRFPLIIASGRDVQLIHTLESLINGLGLQLLGTIYKPLTKESLQAILSRVGSVG